MAISMVRKPSEQPNITNIDDIIPFRYAYGNQNGYVIGRGLEVSHTVNGNQFTVNSGRIVLQGVESDIDANGVTFTIDSVSQLRYYCIYYEVNLATNNTSIKLSDFSTAGYPNIDAGDDLTTNSSGIARLVIYKFTSQSGVINNIEKTITSIKYTPQMSVENSKKINNLELKMDSNGVLKIGDVIIPQKKLVFDFENGSREVTLSEQCKKVEIVVGINPLYNIIGQPEMRRCIILDVEQGEIINQVFNVYSEDDEVFSKSMQVIYDSARKKLYISGIDSSSKTRPDDDHVPDMFLIYKVYKIID